MSANRQHAGVRRGTSDDIGQWQADSTLGDLIQPLPFSIALLGDASSATILNRQFEQNYARDVLDSAPVRALLREARPGWQTVQLSRGDHGRFDVKAQVLRIQGRPMLIFNDGDACAGQQVEQLQARESDAERRSSRDALTGAWNRAHFDRVVSTELNRSIRIGQPVSLILLGVESLKTINDADRRRRGYARSS